jgi:hypothetical protein
MGTIHESAPSMDGRLPRMGRNIADRVCKWKFMWGYVWRWQRKKDGTDRDAPLIYLSAEVHIENTLLQESSTRRNDYFTSSHKLSSESATRSTVVVEHYTTAKLPTMFQSRDHIRENIICRPVDWTDVAKFFLANFITHVFTVISAPGARRRDTMLFTIWALFIPFIGATRAGWWSRVMHVARRMT